MTEQAEEATRLSAAFAQAAKAGESLSAALSGEIALKKALAAREMEIARLRQRIAEMDAHARAAMGREAALQQQLAALYSSTSWRIAAPLRFAKHLVAHFPTLKEWLSLTRLLNRNIPTPRHERHLLVDVSELMPREALSGIHRVTRSILKDLLRNPPEGYRVEPVYATADRAGYRYARGFTSRFLDCPVGFLQDDPVELQQGDAFLGLDFHYVIPTQVDFFSDMRRTGVKIYFVLYDLLPILLPEAFPFGFATLHASWVSILNKHADGVVCISRTVADEFARWLNANGAPRRRPLQIGWFHLGSDVENSAPTYGLPEQAEETLVLFATRPSFLMVGTIEPRKGHTQTLDAFEWLWQSGHEVNLIIVGKQGWMVEPFVRRLHNHPELGKRLFWLEGISDEYLEKTYAACACLIAASQGEGYGLPLIEAARHKLPILARDIPAFREVAGEHASYFSGEEPGDLANAVKNWLALCAENRHPKSDNMPWLTWAQSVERLKGVFLQGNWHMAWPADKKTQSSVKNLFSSRFELSS